MKRVKEMREYDPKQMKILLVEDQSWMRKIEIKIFNTLGYANIIEANDGDAAIDLLKDTDDFDLIVSDWGMPNKDGYDLLVWIRACKKYEKLPFIMTPAQADREQLQKALDAGASGFMPKPFTPDGVTKAIDDVFRKVPMERESLSDKPVKSRSGKVPLRVAHIQVTDHLILGVLRDKIEKGEWSPKHFDLKTLCLPAWNLVGQALYKGGVDAAFMLAPMAQELFAHGVPIKLTLLAHKNGSVFVRKSNGGYAQPVEFFKDHSFLIPHKLSVHHMLAHMFFEKNGLRASLEKGDDVHFEVVAPIHMPEVLRTRQNVAGFMVAEPMGSNSVAAGISDMQFLSGELWENHPCCVVVVRDDFAGPHTDAVYEFTQLLVEAGKYISEFKGEAAETGVRFLDPDGSLGISAPILSKVLTAPHGITTNDLFPIIDDFDTMQRYMHDALGIGGGSVDFEKFIDSRYAEAACQDIRVSAGSLNNQQEEIDLPRLSSAPPSGFKLIVQDGYVKIYRN